ncbi:MAG: hypothetical protein ABF384_00480 [Verrucomicrobiales bacterium]
MGIRFNGSQEIELEWKEGATKIHAFQDWIPYDTLRKVHPYTQQGPKTFP